MTLPEQPQSEGEGQEQELPDPFSKGKIDKKAGIAITPDLGMGKILRKHISIHEHWSKISGRPCPNHYAVEILFPGEDRRLVCDKCYNDGVMEAPE